MTKAHWLTLIRQRLNQQKRRTTEVRRTRAEALEQRAYLSVSTLLVNQELRLTADGNEAIAVQVDPLIAGRVQVLVDGVPSSGLAPIQANQLRAIEIQAGQGHNLIDLNAVRSTEFSFVDLVTGSGLQIQVDAGNGNDTLVGSQSFEDSLFGGDGDDIINFAPLATISIGQVLDGGDGNDVINGGTGDDTLFGRNGVDLVTGGTGNDTILGGDGSDLLNGGDGDDSINGNQGEDAIDGGGGNDTLAGDSGIDTIRGEDGNDLISGGGSGDVLQGDGGTATTPGDDTVSGNSGNDTIRGNGGLDLLQGQDGDDQISVTDAGFSVSNITVDEGDAGDITQAVFTVTLGFELATQSSVVATVTSISATGGQDFVPIVRTLIFAPGVTTQTVSVQILGDALQEQSESIRLTLSNPIGALIQNAQATGTITDNDAPPPSAFTITVNFTGGLTASQQAIFSQAAQRLQQAIIGDVPDITIPGLGLIDDVIIDASGVPIDGVNGILGQAGPTGLRPGSFIPYSGIMQFDTADLGSLEAVGELDEVIAHEMMHVLGFGTIWTDLNLIAGAGSVAPTFLGPQATAEYNLRFNQTGTSVPVEGSAAGPGSADGHWRESVFNNELMTPFLNSGIPNPLSRVTIAHFGDLGYQVNVNAADPYLTGSSAALWNDNPTNSGTTRSFGDDVLNTVPIVGLPTAEQAVQMFGPGRQFSNRAASVVTPASNLAVNDDDLINIINTITFDEAASQPANGLTVEGTTFGYTINGVPDLTGATFNAPGPTIATYLQGANLVGLTTGVLSLDFAAPVSSLSFGLALNVLTAVPTGVTVELFGANQVSLGTQTLAVSPLVQFAEGLFSASGQSVSRATISFAGLPASALVSAFAIDNLVTDDAILGPPPALGNATILGGDGNDTLSGGIEADLLDGGLGNDRMAGSDGSDVLRGGGGLDTAFGGAGNDSMFGQGNTDSLYGGSGDDFVDGGTANDEIYGDDSLGLETGNDTLVGGGSDDLVVGGNGNDLMYGGAGHDTLTGGAGDDTLVGQSGRDTLDGGAGNDQLVWRGGSDSNDVFQAGDGQDGISLRGTGGGDNFGIGQSGSTLTITSGGSTLSIAGPTEMVGSPVEAITLDLLAGNDNVTIGSVNNIGLTILTINGGIGNDVINGATALLGSVRLIVNGDAGNDLVTGTEGNDEINGGEGNDIINGRGGDDLVHGNSGDDVLRGVDGRDSLLGDAGNDNLDGGDGDDSLDGGSGSDILAAGAGNDFAFGDSGDDLLIGADGNDLLEGGAGADGLIGGDGDDTLDGGRQNDTLNGNAGNDKIRGDDGDDFIMGQTGNDTIDGGDGNDTIDGGEGNDGILAGDGDDSVQGGLGDDTIVGGDGNDILLGGLGKDIILGEDGEDLINGNGGSDVISGGEGTNVIKSPVAAERFESFVLSLAILATLDASN